MSHHPPILQGWLEKYKRSSSLLTRKKTTKRWFTIEAITEAQQQEHKQDRRGEHGEFILSYFKSPRASTSDRSGWVFLNDVTQLKEFQEGEDLDVSNDEHEDDYPLNEKTKRSEHQNDCRNKELVGGATKEWVIYIKHPSRVFRLVAVDRYQHQLWFDTIKRYCVNATILSGPVNAASTYGASSPIPHQNLNIGCDEQVQGSYKSPWTTPIKKLEPAEAIHKDVIERRRRESLLEQQDSESKKEHLQIELAFMRGMNRDQESREGNYEEDVVDAMNYSNNTSTISMGVRFIDDVFVDRYTENSGTSTNICRLLRSQPIAGSDSNASIESPEDESYLVSQNNGTPPEEKIDAVSTKPNETILGTRSFQKGFEANNSIDEINIHEFRLQQITSPDETIKKRLERAILSQSSDHKSENDLVVVTTMVQEISSDDSSQDTSSSGDLISKDISDSEILPHNQVITSPNKEPAVEEDHHVTSKRIDSIVSGNYEEGNGASISFDTNCSFLPDEDFLTANWDSD